MNAIYESLSFEERIANNTSVGLMIESLINEDNRESLLPTLEYHFSRTADVEKLVKYKEELGCVGNFFPGRLYASWKTYGVLRFNLISKLQCVEGVRILESLVQYVSEANPEDLSKMMDPITPLRQAWWNARLCIGYALLKRFPKDKEAGITGLNHLNTAPWPSTEKDVKRALSMNAEKHDKNHPVYLYAKAALKAFGPNFRECVPLMLKLGEISKSRGETVYENMTMAF
ncbi:hypothetical protein HK101_007930, partial [Irineochytrium annulatum]